jgi:hypothetical protein
MLVAARGPSACPPRACCVEESPAGSCGLATWRARTGEMGSRPPHRTPPGGSAGRGGAPRRAAQDHLSPAAPPQGVGRYLIGAPAPAAVPAWHRRTEAVEQANGCKCNLSSCFLFLGTIPLRSIDARAPRVAGSEHPRARAMSDDSDGQRQCRRGVTGDVELDAAMALADMAGAETQPRPGATPHHRPAAAAAPHQVN